MGRDHEAEISFFPILDYLVLSISTTRTRRPEVVRFFTLQPMFPPKPFDCSGGLAGFRFFLNYLWAGLTVSYFRQLRRISERTIQFCGNPLWRKLRDTFTQLWVNTFRIAERVHREIPQVFGVKTMFSLHAVASLLALLSLASGFHVPGEVHA